MNEISSSPREEFESCAVRAAASGKVRTLAILASVTVVLECLSAGACAVWSYRWVLATAIPGALVCALACAGLWLLSSQGRAGRVERAGFGLIRVQPIVSGVIAQLLVVLLLLVGAGVLLFPELIRNLLREMGSWESFRAYGENVGEWVGGVLTAMVVTVLLITAAILELCAVREFQLSRYVGGLRRMAAEGIPPKPCRFAEVMSYILGGLLGLCFLQTLIVLLLGWDNSDGSVALDLLSGLSAVMTGVCVFYTGLVLHEVQGRVASMSARPQAPNQPYFQPAPPSPVYSGPACPPTPQVAPVQPPQAAPMPEQPMQTRQETDDGNAR